MHFDKHTLRVLSKLLSLGFASYVVSFLGNLLLIRFYDASAVGLYAATFAMITILQPLSCLAYEGAIPVAKEHKDATNLISLCLLLLLFFAIFAFLFIGDFLIIWIALVYSLNVVLQAIANRRSLFTALGVARFQEAFGFLVISLLLSYNPTSDSFLYATALNYVIICLILYLCVKWDFKMPSLPEIKDVAVRYSDWPKYSLMSNFLNIASANIHLTLIALVFSTELAGLTSFAQKFVQLPYFLIGVAVSQILNSKILGCNDPKEKFVLYKRAILNLSLMAICILAIGAMMPEDVFYFFVPPHWYASLIIIKILLIWGVGQLIGATLSVFYMHEKRLKLFLVLNISGFCLTIGLFLIPYFAAVEQHKFLFALSCLKCVIYLVMALMPFKFLRSANV